MRTFFRNKWVKLAIAEIVYILWFVIWSESWLMLIGVPVIFDIYITKFLFGWIGRKHRARKQQSKLYKEVMSWVEAIVFAVVAATLMHIYVFQLYKIPTPSMEKTLLVGDYLLVSKVSFGPRMPNTPLSVPLVHNTIFGKKSYSEAIKLPYKRLAGFRELKRGDIVVFNFPAGDTIALERQAESYYDLVRTMGREQVERQFTIVARPVDKREHYVKRCVAVAGDTMQIVANQLVINGKAQNMPQEAQHYYIVTFANGTTQNILATNQEVAKIGRNQNVASVEEAFIPLGGEDLFPNDSLYGWGLSDFGPLWIPEKGATVKLTIENLSLYERIITAYEGNSLQVKDDVIYINGEMRDSYTFAMNYFFMMGDNRDNSLDSRFWGFVPEDHIVGTPTLIVFSRGEDGIRWDRMFSVPK